MPAILSAIGGQGNLTVTGLMHLAVQPETPSFGMPSWSIKAAPQDKDSG
jgi:hypothetical protein